MYNNVLYKWFHEDLPILTHEITGIPHYNPILYIHFEMLNSPPRRLCNIIALNKFAANTVY